MPTVGVEFSKVSYTPAGGPSILRDISLSLVAGTTTALLGRSGSGKTTLLRTVNGLAPPTSGEVIVHGKRASGLQDVQQQIALRRGIGYVIQETGLFPHMTVERNAVMSLELDGRPRADLETRAREVIQQVGLDFDATRNRFPWQLSGGQRQRVGLARALALDPSVMLMDEPFGALDPQIREVMQIDMLKLLEAEGKTIVLVTHSLDEAIFLSDTVIIFSANPGRVLTTIDIDLPRPRWSRDEEIKASEAFVRYRHEIWHLMKQQLRNNDEDEQA